MKYENCIKVINQLYDYEFHTIVLLSVLYDDCVCTDNEQFRERRVQRTKGPTNKPSRNQRYYPGLFIHRNDKSGYPCIDLSPQLLKTTELQKTFNVVQTTPLNLPFSHNYEQKQYYREMQLMNRSTSVKYHYNSNMSIGLLVSKTIRSNPNKRTVYSVLLFVSYSSVLSSKVYSNDEVRLYHSNSFINLVLCND